ncbi:MAG: glycosyltransferase, partial [Fibrobacterota bacterium]
CFASGDLPNAERFFLAVPPGDPQHKVALNNLGVVAFQRKEYERARAFFNQSVALDPSYSEAVDNLKALPVPAPCVARKKLALLPCRHDALNRLHCEHLLSQYEIRLPKAMNEPELSALVEWCDQVYALELDVPFIWITQNRPGKPLAVRLGADEVVDTWMENTRWEHVKGVVFAAAHLRDAALSQWQACLGHCRMEVLRDGLDVSRYPLYNNGPGNQFAVLQDFTRHTGTDLLLQCMARAVAQDPVSRFHLSGVLENVRFVTYFINVIKDAGLNTAFKMHKPQADRAAFLKGMNFCLSTALFEGSPVALLEAMACGVKPLVHRWKGADELFPKEWTFASLADFGRMAQSREYTPQAYRDYVDTHFNARKQFAQIDSFLQSL